MMLVLASLLLLTACGDSEDSSTTEAVSNGDTTTTQGADTTPPAEDRGRPWFFGPLTGPTAQAGNALLHGAELRVKKLTVRGILGRSVEL